ncbi:MAG TPA: GDSL-type esterase/lipase family protein [Thermoanaerobaculia bacterium]
MRRFFHWLLPFATALVAASVFAYGFVSFVRGDTGTAVDIAPAATTAAAAAAPRDLIAPVILGDSLARGAGDESGLGIAGRFDAELKQRGIRARRTYNVAVSGARTRDLLTVLDRPNVQQLLRESNVIIVSIGGNDLWGGNDWRNAAPADPGAVMNEVLGRVQESVGKIRKANPRARIFFIGLYNPFITTPMGKQLSVLVNQWNARLLEHFGNDPNFTVVATSDLFSHHDRLALDRFHPGGEGYGLIARRIADSL